MAFKTRDKTNEFIREMLAQNLCGESAEDSINSSGLRELEAFADKNMIPILLPESAAFLRQLCILKNPQKVLEVGTGIGYSGHIILLNSAAHLYTIEHNEASLDTASQFFNRSGLSDRVTFLRGDESEIVPLIEGSYNMIFLDGAKARYPQHLPHLKRLLSSGGILLADNILYNDMVSGINKKVGTKRTIVEGIKIFLDNICSDNDFITSILPVGDGMSLSILK